MEMACDDGRQGPAWDQPAAGTGRTPVLTARALVLGGDGALLPALSLPAPAVAVIRVPVVGAHGSVGPVAGDAVAGAAGSARAGQAHGAEPAGVWALVWGRQGGQGGQGARPAPPRDVQGVHRHRRRWAGP